MYRTGGRFKNLEEHSVGQGLLMEQSVSNSVGVGKYPSCPAGPSMSHFYLISGHSRLFIKILRIAFPNLHNFCIAILVFALKN